MTHDPEAFAAIAAATAPAFSRDGQTLFHLRGSGLPQVWALDLATGDARQLTHHDEKIALLRRSPVDDRLIYGIDRGGDERQQLLLIDPRDASPQPRELTANPAAIHDFGGWSSDGARIAYAANDRDEAHFDVYVQDVASGARQRVFDGSNMISVSGFRSDGATLALLRDRGFGNTSLLLLDVASGEAHRFGSPGNLQSVRWASDGRTLLALTDLGGGDFLRLCRLDPETGEVSVVYEARGRDVEAWAIAPDARLLATVENDRGYAVLRVGPLDGERPVVTGLPRGVVTDLTWSPDGSTLAFGAAAPTEPPSLWLWRDGDVRVAWQPEPGRNPPASSISNWCHGRVSTAHAFPAGSRCRALRHPPPVIPRSSGSTAGRSARRGRISGPTCRCCSRRASPCCCRMCAAAPATAAPIPRATMWNDVSTV